jgi:hypothetical protein
MSQTNLVPDRNLAFENRVQIEPTRARQTEAPASPFRDVLAGGVSVLMGGATIATHVLGTPTLAAAVQQAGASATSALTSSGGAPGAAIAAGATSGLASRDAIVGTPSTPSTTTPGLATSGISDASDMAQMEAMQRESQVFNLQLLDLQEQVQQENRHFTTISNVLRAKHDTAKAAVSNIRA